MTRTGSTSPAGPMTTSVSATAPHFCLGAHLARLQMRLMLTDVIERMPDIQLTGKVERVASNLIGGIKRMPVKFTPRRASAA